MAKCKICGETYLQEKCPYCNMKIDGKEKKITGTFNTKNKINIDKELFINEDRKTIKTVLIIIAVCISIITFLILRNEYREYKTEQLVKEMLFGTTNDDVIIEKTNRMIKQSNKMMEENRKKMEQMFKIPIRKGNKKIPTLM